MSMPQPLEAVAVMAALLLLLYAWPKSSYRHKASAKVEGLEQVRLWLAIQRPAPIRFLFCVIGKHNPPTDKAFTIEGYVYLGGPCSRCPDQTFREVCSLGFASKFDAFVTEPTPDNENAQALSPFKLAAKLREDLGLKLLGEAPY
jgi:hypothetical protein